MFWYIYYGYLAYKYFYILEYIQYTGKIYRWITPSNHHNDEIEKDRDWILCGVDDALDDALDDLYIVVPD